MSSSSSGTNKENVAAGKANITKESGKMNFIMLSSEQANNADEAQKVFRAALGRLGCPGCTSGLNLAFLNHEDFFKVMEKGIASNVLVADKQGQVRGLQEIISGTGGNR